MQNNHTVIRTDINVTELNYVQCFDIKAFTDLTILQSVMSVKQIRQSRALQLEEKLSISSSRSRLSNVVVGRFIRKLRLSISGTYLTGFAAQLSWFRRCCGQVNFPFGYKESNY